MLAQWRKRGHENVVAWTGRILNRICNFCRNVQTMAAQGSAKAIIMVKLSFGRCVEIDHVHVQAQSSCKALDQRPWRRLRPLSSGRSSWRASRWRLNGFSVTIQSRATRIGRMCTETWRFSKNQIPRPPPAVLMDQHHCPRPKGPKIAEGGMR